MLRAQITKRKKLLQFSVVVLLAILTCTISACIPAASKIKMAVYGVSPDSKYIYGINATGFSDENNQEHFALYRANYDFTNPKLIKKNVWDAWLSPTGKYLLSDDLDEINLIEGVGLSVIDTTTFKVVHKIRRDERADGEYYSGWHPNGHAFCYTVWKGKNNSSVYMYDLKTKQTSKIANGSGTNWSLDGKYFLVVNSGLVLYDYKQKNKKVILTEPNEHFEEAVISGDAKTVCYTTSHESKINTNDKITRQLKTASINGTNKRVLWSNTFKLYDAEQIYGLHIVNDEILIAKKSRDWLAFDLKTNKEASPSYMYYDYYNPLTKTIYWTNQETGVLKQEKFN